MADKAAKISTRISLTLPISCQICLGKVKQPVACSNHHVFCETCLEVWLERNAQCPTCRVSINQQQPPHKLYGGPSEPAEETADSFSKNKNMRETRVQVLFKDYEDAIERMEAEVYLLKHENEILKTKLRERPEEPSAPSPARSSPPDAAPLLALTRKLQDAATAYDRVKKEMAALKKENGSLKDENTALTHENQKLRLDLSNRSPRRYGRLTVATLESRVESYERRVRQLERALETSDAHVEQMEQERAQSRLKLRCVSACPKCTVALQSIANNFIEQPPKSPPSRKAEKTVSNSSRKATGPKPPSPSKISSTGFYGKKPCLLPESGGKNLRQTSEPSSLDSSGAAPSGTLDSDLDLQLSSWRGSGARLQKGGERSDSVEFELPPTPSTSFGKLSLESRPTPSTSMQDHQPTIDVTSSTMTEVTSFGLELPSPTDSPQGSCRKRLKFDATSGSAPSSAAGEAGVVHSRDQNTAAHRTTNKETRFNTGQNQVYEWSVASGDSSLLSESMASDLRDAMQILDAAERNVRGSRCN